MRRFGPRPSELDARVVPAVTGTFTPGNDTRLGGAGNDVLVGEAGTDVLDRAPGTDVVLQSPPVVP